MEDQPRSDARGDEVPVYSCKPLTVWTEHAVVVHTSHSLHVHAIHIHLVQMKRRKLSEDRE